jgi:hypothetical protein
MDSRICSAVLTQVNGRGLAFQFLIQSRMSASSLATLRWVPRRIFRVVTSPNQRSTRLSQLELVGMK